MTGDSTSAARADSTGTAKPGHPDDAASACDDGVTRRTFIRASGAAAAAGATGVLADDAAAQAQTYRFGGEVAAWRGREPAAIEGEENPTIELEAGQEYELWFENIDGQPHNIAVRDADENVIAQSETVSEEGATASVTFTATSEMADYICLVHPSTMIADVNVTGQVEGGGEGGESGGLSSLPFGAVVVAVGIALAFVSPLLFALFLFSRGGDRGGETTTRT